MNGFNEQKPNSVSLIEIYKEVIGHMYEDFKVVLACNLHAVQQDGRSKFEYPAELLNLVFRLNVHYKP